MDHARNWGQKAHERGRAVGIPHKGSGHRGQISLIFMSTISHNRALMIIDSKCQNYELVILISYSHQSFCAKWLTQK